MAGFGQARRDAYDRSARSEHWRSTFAGLTAFERHQRLLRQLGAYDGAGGQEQGGADDPAAALAGIRTDADVLRQVGRGRPLMNSRSVQRKAGGPLCGRSTPLACHHATFMQPHATRDRCTGASQHPPSKS
jgi:hypothetical protein